MVSIENVMAEIVRNEVCHCTVRKQLDTTTVESIGREDNERRGLIKVINVNSGVRVKFYLTEFNDRKTITISNTDEIETKLSTMFHWMHDKVEDYDYNSRLFDIFDEYFSDKRITNIVRDYERGLYTFTHFHVRRNNEGDFKIKVRREGRNWIRYVGQGWIMNFDENIGYALGEARNQIPQN